MGKPKMKATPPATAQAATATQAHLQPDLWGDLAQYPLEKTADEIAEQKKHQGRYPRGLQAANQRRAEEAKLRRGAKGNPMVAVYGPGPAGKRCMDCGHLLKKQYAGTYWKCTLRGNTNGPGTDHRYRYPACARFSDKVIRCWCLREADSRAVPSEWAQCASCGKWRCGEHHTVCVCCGRPVCATCRVWALSALSKRDPVEIGCGVCHGQKPAPQPGPSADQLTEPTEPTEPPTP